MGQTRPKRSKERLDYKVFSKSGKKVYKETKPLRRIKEIIRSFYL